MVQVRLALDEQEGRVASLCGTTGGRPERGAAVRVGVERGEEGSLFERETDPTSHAARVFPDSVQAGPC